MKTIRFCLCGMLLLIPFAAGWAQEKLFNKYCDMDEVKSVYISKTMLDMHTDILTDDLYLGKAKNLTSARMLSTMDDEVRKEMFKDIRALVKSSKYELLMKQKSTVASAEFYIARQGDRIKELIMVRNGTASLKFIYLEGNMTTDDVQKILLYQDTSARERKVFTLPHADNLADLQIYMDPNSAWWKDLKEKMKQLDKSLDSLR